MSETLGKVRSLIEKGKVRVSDHGYDELSAEGLTAREVIHGIVTAVVIEDSPEYPKGPCVLVRQHHGGEQPIHVLWGIPKGHAGPAVLVTAYRPDPERWDDDFLRRRR